LNHLGECLHDISVDQGCYNDCYGKYDISWGILSIKQLRIKTRTTTTHTKKMGVFSNNSSAVILSAKGRTMLCLNLWEHNIQLLSVFDNEK
jgi:hypothetical protein